MISNAKGEYMHRVEPDVLRKALQENLRRRALAQDRC